MKSINHECVFYSSDSVLIETVTRFVAPAMNADGAAIVIATEPHQKDLIQRLNEAGVDLKDATKRGTYVSLNAADTLWTIISNAGGTPALLGTFCTLVESAAKATQQERPRIVLFGECVGLLYTLGHLDAAIALENAGNTLIERYNQYSLDILCGYPLLRWKQDDNDFERICAEHSAFRIAL